MDAAAPAVAPPAASRDVVFREMQRRPFSRLRWAAVVLYAGLIAVGWILRSHARLDWVGRSIEIAMVAFTAYLVLARETLVTEVANGSLHVFFRRGFGRTVPLASIRSADVVSYYGMDGGFGVRAGKAVRLRLADAPEPLLVASQRPDELLVALGRPGS